MEALSQPRLRSARRLLCQPAALRLRSPAPCCPNPHCVNWGQSLDLLLSRFVRRRRGVAPSTALRLARFLDTSPGFWMNLQLTRDLFHAQQVEEEDLKRISPLLKSSGVVVR